MNDKVMHNPNDDTQNYHFCRSQLEVETFAPQPIKVNQRNSPKWSNQQIIKLYYKTLWTSIINSPPNVSSLPVLLAAQYTDNNSIKFPLFLSMA